MEPGDTLQPRPPLPGDCEADEPLVLAMGPELVANFLVIKREEWKRFTEAATDWELAQYLWFC